MRLSLLPLLLLACPVLAQYGTLDPTFSTDGIVQTAVELPSAGYAVAVQPDGRILVAGGADSTGTVVRYMPDGSLDESFGTGGVVRLLNLQWTVIRGIALQSTGKIIVCGLSQFFLTSTIGSMITARFNSNGTIDNSYGENGNGVATESLDSNHSGSFFDVEVLPNNKVLATGWSFAGVSGATFTFQYSANGLLDATFGNGGLMQYGTFLTLGYNWNEAYALAVQPDGKVLIGGLMRSNTLSDRFVARFLANGTLDNTFGDEGLALLDAGPDGLEFGSDVLVQGDGKILLVGTSSSAANSIGYCITRLNTDGTLDNSYGVNGNAMSADLGSIVVPGRGVLQPDAKLVFVTTSSGAVDHPSVWRLNADGTPDPTFGDNGRVAEITGIGHTALYGTAMQADGKILVCGRSGGEETLTAARLSSGLPLGLDELHAPLAITLFPNPANGRYTLRTTTKLDRVEVVDALGRVLHSERNVQGDHPLDLSRIAPGRYLLRGTVGGTSSTLSFVKD